MSLTISAQRLSERAPHLAPLTKGQVEFHAETLKKMAEISRHLDPIPDKIFSLRNYKVTFDLTFERVAVLNVLDRSGAGKIYDIRKVRLNEEIYYLPYSVEALDDFEFENVGVLVTKADPDAIFISQINNFGQKERLGSTLVQLAIEESLKQGLEGRVVLNSAAGAEDFYTKLGFEKQILKGPFGTKKMRMSLSVQSIAAWQTKIAAFPILR